MRFVVTGGGTGGHIYPALAIARGLSERFSGQVYYIGGARGLESSIVPKEGLPFKAIQLAGFRRGLYPANILAAYRAAVGINSARRYLREIRPAAVVGTGGYVCGPVVLAAALSGIPTLIHEQNALPGITNRLLSRFAGCVAVTFGEARRYFPARAAVKVTGLPVRPEIMAKSKDEARQKFGLPGDGLVVLSFGGSQGARSINRAVLPLFKHFAGRKGIFFLHVAGPGNYDGFLADMKSINAPDSGNITITSYMYDMPDALAAADLVISRAGAATLAELTAVGLPAILVPYPYAAENHQEYNARALERKGAAVVIRDKNLNGDSLISEVERITGRRGLLEEMAGASKKLGRPGAISDILDCVQVLLDNKRR